jgi:hypothetical protein
VAWVRARRTHTKRRARKVIVGTCAASAPSAHVNMCVMTQTAEAKNSAALERHTHTRDAHTAGTRIEFSGGGVPAIVTRILLFTTTKQRQKTGRGTHTRNARLLIGGRAVGRSDSRTRRVVGLREETTSVFAWHLKANELLFGSNSPRVLPELRFLSPLLCCGERDTAEHNE